VGLYQSKAVNWRSCALNPNQIQTTILSIMQITIELGGRGNNLSYETVDKRNSRLSIKWSDFSLVIFFDFYFFRVLSLV
jgi:hypothetical protein